MRKKEYTVITESYNGERKIFPFAFEFFANAFFEEKRQKFKQYYNKVELYKNGELIRS